MYWHVLILTIESGYATLRLDPLLQFSPASSAVLETTASNHNNASSSMFQSTAAGPAANLVTSPALIGGGSSAAPVFRGAQQLPQQRPASVQARQRQRRQGARRYWRWRRQRVWAWGHRWVGHGSSLGASDELACQVPVLGRWTSPSAGFLEDVVVECGERVTELCSKFVRGHGIKFST